MDEQYQTLDYLRQVVAGNSPRRGTPFHYPTAISKLLGFEVVFVEKAQATLQLKADASIHGNQQGTVHGGLLSELADAAIGTAHSTATKSGDSFTSLDLQINFYRPVWNTVLTAKATPVKQGWNISHYQCEIHCEEGKLVALAHGTVMTLRGAHAQGR